MSRNRTNAKGSARAVAIGVDLGGTSVRVAAIDDEGALLERFAAPSRAGTPDEVLDVACRAIDELAKLHSGATRPLVGVGVAGILDASSGVLVEAPSLPGWSGLDVRAALEHRLEKRFVMDNDANLGALGEAWCGAARGADNVCMLTLGTGIGGGWIHEGRPFRGMTGMAAEFGHMTVQREGLPCRCGGRGCLEQYASASAVERMARATPALTEALADAPSGGVARHVHTLALRGISEARRIFEEVGAALGVGLAALVNALNLPIYVVGGGLSAAWEMFAPALFRELRERSFVYRATEPREGLALARTTRIVPASFPADAGLFGAARLALLEAESRQAHA
ncbi:MAG: ROK family protein [Polyangiaceae bacterium]